MSVPWFFLTPTGETKLSPRLAGGVGPPVHFDKQVK